MRRIPLPKQLARLEHTFILQTATIISGFGMLILSLTFIVWAAFFQSQTKVLTGVNYYDHPVIVTFENAKVQVDPFENYSFLTTDFAPVKIEVSDTSGNLLTTRRHNLSRTASISIDILSDKDTAQQCYTQATVTSLFYVSPTTKSQPTDIKELTNVGTTSFDLDVASVNDTVLYPGNYNGETLPAQIDHQQHVWGVYPVDCSDIGNQDALSQDITNWSNANPTAQRELYAEKVREIVDSPEYNH